MYMLKISTDSAARGLLASEMLVPIPRRRTVGGPREDEEEFIQNLERPGRFLTRWIRHALARRQL
jgi:hypothetical protein